MNPAYWNIIRRNGLIRLLTGFVEMSLIMLEKTRIRVSMITMARIRMTGRRMMMKLMFITLYVIFYFYFSMILTS